MRYKGFTLVEVLVSVALMSLVGIYFLTSQINDAHDRMVRSVAQDVLTLANSSMAYFVYMGEWPDQSGNCTGLIDALDAANAFPATNSDGSYTGAVDSRITARCSASGSPVGATLQITVQFPAGADDDADLLMGYLPTSTIDTSGAQPEVTHYVAAPRRATSNRYQFYKETLNSNSAFEIDKPSCGSGDTPAYLVIPLSLCVPGTAVGLGGYYFREITPSDASKWNLQLMVANGNNTGPGDFFVIGGPVPTVPLCDGRNVEVGAITYCE